MKTFAPGVLERFYIASEGNLRELFGSFATPCCLRVSGHPGTHSNNPKAPIAGLRNDYKQFLGSTGKDSSDAPLNEKLEPLV